MPGTGMPFLHQKGMRCLDTLAGGVKQPFKLTLSILFPSTPRFLLC